MTNPIAAGDRVRSFDFAMSLDDGTQIGRDLEGERACFIEGIVVRITDPATHESFRDCPRYEILVERKVFGGEDLGSPERPYHVYPPVNGARTLFRRPPNYVERA